MDTYRLSHLDALEAESIHIMREVAAEFQRPVLLFSGGKDSLIMLRLAEKAFRPAKFPFPVMHIDTGHNFPEVLQYRDELIKGMGERLIVRTVEAAIKKGLTSDKEGSVSRNQQQAPTLTAAIEEFKFDAAFGGGRRDEEKARAKERIFSIRNDEHAWDPQNQRPELWSLYNSKINLGESVRAFPISNWTELDVWQYIQREELPIPSIYLTHERDVWFDTKTDSLLPVSPWYGPKREDMIKRKRVRFRTIGDMVCTGAIESEANSIDDIINEIAVSRISERGLRADDKVSATAMEERKLKGYF